MAEKCLRQNIWKSKEGERFQSTQTDIRRAGELLESFSMQKDYIVLAIHDDPTARFIIGHGHH
jgi:hypothetical protein